MRRIAMAAAFVCAVAPLQAAELEAVSKVDAVTVYPDGASVTRIVNANLARGDTTLVLGDFPPTLDPSSLRIEGVGRVTIGSIDARPPRPERPASNPELENKLEALRDERQVLGDAIAAAATRKKFVERFATEVPLGVGEEQNARPIGEWRTAFAAVQDELAVVDAALRDTKLKQRALDREIAKVEAALRGNPARKMEVRVDLAAAEPGTATFRVTYTVRGARWVPLYDARLDSGSKDRKPALELVRRAEIAQNTGEDWSDVALSVSTVRTAKGGDAPDLKPLVVRFRPEPRGYAGGAPSSVPAPAPVTRQRAKAADNMREDRRAEEQEATVENSGFQILFRIPGRVTVAANEGAKALRIGSSNIDPELLVRASPALDETAFLEASFKHTEDAPLLAGRTSIYRDGIFVGRGATPATPKEELVRLGFGADEKVKITRVAVKKTEGSTGIISTSKVDEREFKTTVRNGHDRPLKIQIEDQLPVSEHQDVQVEMLPATTPPTLKDVRDRKGVIAWVIDAKPGEAKEIKLAWRVKWPTDKAIVYQPGT